MSLLPLISMSTAWNPPCPVQREGLTVWVQWGSWFGEVIRVCLKAIYVFAEQQNGENMEGSLKMECREIWRWRRHDCRVYKPECQRWPEAERTNRAGELASAMAKQSCKEHELPTPRLPHPTPRFVFSGQHWKVLLTLGWVLPTSVKLMEKTPLWRSPCLVCELFQAQSGWRLRYVARWRVRCYQGCHSGLRKPPRDGQCAARLTSPCGTPVWAMCEGTAETPG